MFETGFNTSNDAAAVNENLEKKDQKSFHDEATPSIEDTENPVTSDLYKIDS